MDLETYQIGSGVTFLAAVLYSNKGMLCTFW
jgi:hypothetical protein